ncbi:MAG: SRPBCC family protein [Acidiferrobacteraceae bacterium]
MSDHTPTGRSIVIERTMPHSPEKVWRALTQSALIAEWLMENDFEPRLGGTFQFRAKPMGNWNGRVDCEITAFEPNRRLVYTWRGGSVQNAPHGAALDGIVEWTLTPVPGGTRVRMEHSGFGPQNASAYETMSGGWPRVLDRLEHVTRSLEPDE